MPTEFADFELMIEWGLTQEQFDCLPFEAIGKIREYRQAKAIGEERKTAAQKTK